MTGTITYTVKAGEHDCKTKPHAGQGAETQPPGLAAERGAEDGDGSADESEGNAGYDAAKGAICAHVRVRGAYEAAEALFEHFVDL